MENPLLNQSALPNFTAIIPDQIEDTLTQLIAQNRVNLNEILEHPGPYTWENLMAPLEEMSDRLSKMWSPIAHMHAVAETDDLRAVYKRSLPLLVEYHTELMQNEKLFQAIQSIADNKKEYEKLSPAQRKIIDNEIRDFKLAGVNLLPAEKAHFGELQKNLSKLSSQFGENLLDATHGWSLHVTDENALRGIPKEALKIAEQNAQLQNKPGWIFTLDHPSYSAFIKYADNRELRWLMYEAFVTRASDQGPNAGKWDNSPIMEDILKTRHELANLLGFKSYAEYSLATKMANTPEQVMHFLNDLVDKSKAFGEQDVRELTEFAKSRDGLAELEAWDVAYYSEKLRESRYALSQEDVRPYFQINKVLAALFEVVNKLYGIKVVEKQQSDTWNPSVQFFEIYDEEHKLRGYFYTDLYARPHKRDGAWMDDCRGRRRLKGGKIQLPVAFLTCNFTRPLNNNPALLTHDEVLTLFHEFGHCLQHLLTKVDYSGVAGINGVPWDAVEFPSQFLEFWCWDKETLQMMSEHYETKAPLPDALYNKLIAAKNFQAGIIMLRQLEFALFDFQLHSDYERVSKKDGIQTLLKEVRKKVGAFKIPSFNRFQHSFAHIFAGGYAAGYYSYKWAEVLASDAFSKFEERGIFDAETGKEFLKYILEPGGTYDPMELFVSFRGREPEIEPLLRHSGLLV